MALFGYGTRRTPIPSLPPSAKSGRTPERTPLTTTPLTTPITTQLSGPSSVASNPPDATGSGDIPTGGELAFGLALLERLDKHFTSDPYWYICAALWRLLSRKRGYYGCGQNPLENALGVAHDGIEPWLYQVARIGEKCRRLRGLNGTIGSRDAIRETLMDIAGHSAVAIACLDHTHPRKEPQ